MSCASQLLCGSGPSYSLFCDFSLFVCGLFLIANLVGHQGVFIFKLKYKILYEQVVTSLGPIGYDGDMIHNDRFVISLFLPFLPNVLFLLKEGNR